MRLKLIFCAIILLLFTVSCGENYHLTLESESSDNPSTDVDQVSVTCSVSPTTPGTFVSGAPSSGFIAVPVSTTDEADISVEINQNGFSGSFNGTVTATDSAIIIPITYDGSGSAGDDMVFSLTSDNFDTPCIGNAHILTPLELAFGERASRYVEDGNHAVCGMQLDKDIFCWGRGAASVQARGAGGNFVPVQQTMPVGVDLVAILPLESNGYAITADGDLYSWGQYLRTAAVAKLLAILG